jgi:hypothetical protein
MTISFPRTARRVLPVRSCPDDDHHDYDIHWAAPAVSAFTSPATSRAGLEKDQFLQIAVKFAPGTWNVAMPVSLVGRKDLKDRQLQAAIRIAQHRSGRLDRVAS